MAQTPITFNTNPLFTIMKPLRTHFKLFVFVVFAIGCLSPANLFATTSQYFEVITNKQATTPPSPKREYVEFSIINDTENDYFYYLGGSVECVKKGTTRTFSTPEGIDIYHAENGKEEKGRIWFKIMPLFNKKVFKLSEITKEEIFLVKE